MAPIIIGLGLMFFLGHALNWFFEQTKIPDLLILVVIGYLMGPIFGIMDASDFGKVGAVLSTTALIVILYEGGIHLSARDLLTSSLPAMGLTILGFTTIVAAGTLTAVGLGFQEWPISVLLGVGIGSTSSAIVIPMVKNLSIDKNTKTILGLESAFTDVLTIVIFLVLVDSFSSGKFDAQELAIGIGPKTIIAGLMGIASGLIWAFVKKKYAQVLTMAFAGEAWALLTYGIIEASHHNGAIGVLALGFMLANLDLLPSWLKNQLSSIPVTYKDMSLLSEITFLLRTFFFIYLGLLIQFSNWSIVFIGLVITALIFLTRYIAVRILYRPQKYTRLDAMVTTAMGPRGLACAVLATIPLQKGLPGGQWLQDVLFAVIPFTITFTAVFVALSENSGFRMKAEKLFSSYGESGATQNIEESTATSVVSTDAAAPTNGESET